VLAAATAVVTLGLMTFVGDPKREA